ncbi:hypothetical protein EC957_001496 [Mortierella hygrophila]|uniref:Protection of telomeres protein 1 ssDNA-binding domain-containing protein n=1 Tax=Mortierella hygrophila TaxID=979708 RepID=A0A9P6F699_9FUNG|nr:hypothetical protein EC957_001496 [Mortierella hygrophila]
MKATLILTDYTEHPDLPYNDAEERPTGKASIIATLWDEHCLSAQDANISAGDLVSLKNLVPKMGRNGHIALDMHGNRRYLVNNPVQKLGTDHDDVQELLLRKHKYLAHVNEEFVASQMAERAQQHVGSASRGLEAASIEPEHEYGPQPGPINYEPENVSAQSLPLLQRTPTLYRDSITRPSADLAHNLRLSVYSRLSVNASSSTASAAIASTSTARSLSRDLWPVVDRLPKRDVVFPAERESSALIKGEPSPLVALKMEAAHEYIRPVVGASVECESHGPREREASSLFAVRAEAPPRDIQPAFDATVESKSSIPVEPEATIPVQPESSVHTERESTPLVAVKLEPDYQNCQPTLSSASTPAPSTPEPVIVRTSPTFVHTEMAKEAKKEGCCLMPLRARVVGFEPETLIDFSSPVCRECKHKYRPRSKTKPSRQCPGCNLENAVEFKYSFKLYLMDELDEPYSVDVDGEHATKLIGVPAGDLVKDFEKLGIVTERLARIGVSEARNQDEGLFFDLCVQEHIKRSGNRKETMGANQKRTGSPLPSREAKRHASSAQEVEGPEFCQTPPPSPLSAEKKNTTSNGGIISVERSLVFTEIMKKECDRIEEGVCEGEYYDALNPTLMCTYL